MVIRLFKPKHIDVGWTCWTSSLKDSNWRETVTDRPKKVSGPKLAQGDVRYCPAFNNFYKNVFAITMPFDICLNVIDGKVIYSPMPSLTADVSSLMSIVYEDAVDSTAVQLFLNNMFVSDTPNTIIETLPPILHGTREEIRYMNGRFDIHAWQRPLHFGFHVPKETKDKMNLDDGLIFEKGETVMYVRINTPNGESVRLHTMSHDDVKRVSDYTHRNVHTPLNIRKFNFDEIINRVRYRRPKQFLRDKTYDTEK